MKNNLNQEYGITVICEKPHSCKEFYEQSKKSGTMENRFISRLNYSLMNDFHSIIRKYCKDDLISDEISEFFSKGIDAMVKIKFISDDDL